MSSAALAVIWHYWIGVAMFLACFAVVAGIVAGYFLKVVRPRYPSKR